MQPFKAKFDIIEVSNCPLYQAGEGFLLTEKAFSPPDNKETCLILVREMTELLFTLLTETEEKSGTGKDFEKIYTCSGCNGLIKFRATSLSDSDAEIKNQIQLDPEKQELFGQIINCPLFQTMSADHLQEMMDFCHEQKIENGQTLIRKGESNVDIFLVLSGELSVDDGPVHITNLCPGELCGEMSYFAGHIAGANVTALTETRVAVISGEFFSYILEESSSVQLFLAQLLAKRLVSSNKARLHDFDSSMQGRLSDMVPSELFQILHMHQKTGVLSLAFPGRDAQVSFCEGRIVNACYNGSENKDAVYAVLAETEGSYTFRSGLSPTQMKAVEIGDFNALLMEGIQRIDEGDELS